jgi:hypothetical protein
LKKRKGNPWGQIAFLWIFFMCLFLSKKDIFFFILLSFFVSERIFFILFCIRKDIFYLFFIRKGYFLSFLYPFWISFLSFLSFLDIHLSFLDIHLSFLSFYLFWIFFLDRDKLCGQDANRVPGFFLVRNILIFLSIMVRKKLIDKIIWARR